MYSNKLLLCLALISSPAHAFDDKAKHFFAGALIGTFTGKVTDSKLLGFTAGCAAGVAKEINDNRKRTFDSKDFIATCIGSMVSFTINF
jgi:uncharacterized protein YfiM (DUF2279 family)